MKSRRRLVLIGAERRASGEMASPRVSVPPAPPSPASPSPLQAPPNTPNGVGRTPTLPARRQPVLLSRPAPSRGARCAEVAGGTAADCAAVCCCCPCGILSLVVLALVKLPAGLCRRAFLKQKQKRNAAKRKKGDGDTADSVGTTRRGLLGPKVGEGAEEVEDDEFVIFGGRGGPVVVGPGTKGLLVGSLVEWPAEWSPSVEVLQMDKEMWTHFYGAGFWRSPSQKDV